jgi:hypothetical protein
MSENPTPEEPNLGILEDDLGFSPLDEEAVHMHELHKSLIKAGFRDKQALLLVAMIAADMREESMYVERADPEDYPEPYPEDFIPQDDEDLDDLDSESD